MRTDDATGEDIRCKLTLQAASNIDNDNFDATINSTDRTMLALHDLSPSRLVATGAATDTIPGKYDGSPSVEASNPTPTYLPLASIAEMRCQTNKTNATKQTTMHKARRGLFSFEFIVHGSTALSRGQHEAQACLRQGGQTHTYTKRGVEPDLCGEGRPGRLDGPGEDVQEDCYSSHQHFTRRRQVKPFGIVQAGSDEQLCAIVLGVASVM